MSVTFTTQLTGVSVYPYLGVPILVKPVITGATAEYVVGTFLASVGYQLYVSGGERPGTLTRGAAYYAVGTDAQGGGQVVTHFMYAEDIGANPHFGYVQTLGVHADAPQPDYEEAPVPA
jgi:hypothetical protein